MREPGNLGSQVKWAGAASVAAVLAEAPFDKTKHLLFGSKRTLL